jgi:uncharacterized damage-inducible protein DinB
MDDKVVRDYLRRFLNWREAHADLKSAFKDVPFEDQGKRPPKSPHSPWQILEHMRLAQNDILEFCTNPQYKARNWPDDYWPKKSAPPDKSAWGKSVKAFEKDLKDLQDLVSDPKTDLETPVPHGSGQTVFREALLVADHNAYHVGQLVLVRRLLGCWPET